MYTQVVIDQPGSLGLTVGTAAAAAVAAAAIGARRRVPRSTLSPYSRKSAEPLFRPTQLSFGRLAGRGDAARRTGAGNKPATCTLMTHSSGNQRVDPGPVTEIASRATAAVAASEKLRRSFPLSACRHPTRRHRIYLLLAAALLFEILLCSSSTRCLRQGPRSFLSLSGRPFLHQLVHSSSADVSPDSHWIRPIGFPLLDQP